MSKKTVFLLIPPGKMEEHYGKLARASTELPLLGLAYIAATLRASGHQVTLKDYEINRANERQVVQDLRQIKPDIVGMSTYITNIDKCLSVAKLVKLEDPRIKVILGGPHVTLFPKEAVQHPYVDFIVIGEGETTIVELLDNIDNQRALFGVDGLAFRDCDGNVVITKPRKLIERLDGIPFPALDLYEMEKYFPSVHIRGKKVAHLMTSRGCPFKCTFCAAREIFGSSFRYHSADRLIEEINLLSAKYGYNSFQFYDDIFTLNKRRVYDLCEKIIENGKKIEWMCFTRTDCIDRNLLDSMREAGCYLITFGCESGNDELLELLNKKLTVKKNLEGIRMTKEAGIIAASSFMLGLPTETREQSLETINFALNSGLGYAYFPIFEPLPGTEIWNLVQETGYFIDAGKCENKLLISSSKIWVPHGRTRQELEDLARYAFRKFYIRPETLARVSRNIFHVPIGRLLRLFWAGFCYFTIEKSKASRRGTRF